MLGLIAVIILMVFYDFFRILIIPRISMGNISRGKQETGVPTIFNRHVGRYFLRSGCIPIGSFGSHQAHEEMKESGEIEDKATANIENRRAKEMGAIYLRKKKPLPRRITRRTLDPNPAGSGVSRSNVDGGGAGEVRCK